MILSCKKLTYRTLHRKPGARPHICTGYQQIEERVLPLHMYTTLLTEAYTGKSNRLTTSGDCLSE